MKVRVQIGHYGRKTGATGAYNSSLNLSEANMNKALADTIEDLVKDGASDFEWEFLGPDVRPYSNCDYFIALHMDGSNNTSADGPSVGFPTKESKKVQDSSNRFAELWKTRRGLITGSGQFRGTNYTRALQLYYGYKSSYSGNKATVKVVLENGFVTNNSEANWAIANREEVAQSIIDTVHIHAGVTTKRATKSVSKGQPAEKLALDDYWQAIQKATGLTYSAEVELWQRLLTRAGFPAAADGKRGPKTEAAHREWCNHVRLSVREVPGRQAWKIMLKALTVKVGDPADDERVRQLTEELEKTIKLYESVADEADQWLDKTKELESRIDAARSALDGGSI